MFIFLQSSTPTVYSRWHLIVCPLLSVAMLCSALSDHDNNNDYLCVTNSSKQHCDLNFFSALNKDVYQTVVLFVTLSRQSFHNGISVFANSSGV